MGLCFSCLYGEEDDGNNNERSSLLHSGQIYLEENLQEEAKKQQKRQNELAGIVNELSDNLIDVSTFMSNPTALESSHQMSFLAHGDEAGGNDRAYPSLISTEEKQAVLEAVRSLDETTKSRCQVHNTQPLFLNF